MINAAKTSCDLDAAPAIQMPRTKKMNVINGVLKKTTTGKYNYTTTMTGKVACPKILDISFDALITELID